jgi:hypothetical protein
MQLTHDHGQWLSAAKLMNVFDRWIIICGLGDLDERSRVSNWA